VQVDAHPPRPTGLSAVNPSLALLAGQLATTVTTFAPGDPKLATSDPSNTTGLVMVILVNLLIIGGGVLLYLRHRRKPGDLVADGGSGQDAAVGASTSVNPAGVPSADLGATQSGD